MASSDPSGPLEKKTKRFRNAEGAPEDYVPIESATN